MEKKKFPVHKKHAHLTILARRVYILGKTEYLEELNALQSNMEEFPIRWAYICAGIEESHINELLASKYAEVAA